MSLPGMRYTERDEEVGMEGLVRKIRRVTKRVPQYDEKVAEYFVQLPNGWSERMAAEGKRHVLVDESEHGKITLWPLTDDEVAERRLRKRRANALDAYHRRVGN